MDMIVFQLKILEKKFEIYEANRFSSNFLQRDVKN